MAIRRTRKKILKLSIGLGKKEGEKSPSCNLKINDQ
jgi:hypothetical protein